jgi:hypothetical protein
MDMNKTKLEIEEGLHSYYTLQLNNKGIPVQEQMNTIWEEHGIEIKKNNPVHIDDMNIHGTIKEIGFDFVLLE